MAAFGLAPIIPALLFAVLSPAYAGLPDMSSRILKTFAFVLVVGGHIPALFVGLPTYAILRRWLRPTWLNCIAAGAFVAALPWALLGLIPMADQASINGSATIVDGRLTWFGVVETLYVVTPIAALGAVGGAAFWVILWAWRSRTHAA